MFTLHFGPAVNHIESDKSKLNGTLAITFWYNSLQCIEILTKVHPD